MQHRGRTWSRGRQLRGYNKDYNKDHEYKTCTRRTRSKVSDDDEGDDDDDANRVGAGAVA